MNVMYKTTGNYSCILQLQKLLRHWKKDLIFYLLFSSVDYVEQGVLRLLESQ